MEEFSLIQAIKQPHYANSTLIKGVGDDAAIFRQPAQDIVTAVDTFVEDVHFSRMTMAPIHIGYRALAANISDMAAMGASPTFYLVSIVVPKKWNERDVLDIFRGMKSLATEHGMDLIGGDTVSGKELMISITVIGYVEKGRARYRHLAQARDVVFVTGTLGDARAGLHILQNEHVYQHEKYFIKRHRLPTPRVNFARDLSSLSRVALNDLSDGIANEAAEIAESSQVNITLVSENIPVSDGFGQFSTELQRHWKYFGGEDFELFGTVAANDWDIVKKSARRSNTKVTKIGYVTQNTKECGKVYLKEDNQTKQIMKNGYTHLK